MLESGRRVWSALFGGGRRGGKTDLAVKVAIAFAVMVPFSRVWLVSPAQPETEELELVLESLLPTGWFKKLGAPWYTYTLPNGSKIWLRSAHDPKKLKRGRCDFAILNEAQNMARQAYTNVRGALADNAGFCILAANPPDHELGQWVYEYHEEAEAGRRPSMVFHFDPRENPHVEIEALEALEGEVDDRTYAIEILGQFLPPKDVVFYSLSQDNIRERPDFGSVTAEFLKANAHGSHEFDRVVGLDFQKKPHQVAITYEFFANPDPLDPDPLMWITDETYCEDATEQDLIDALEAKGYTGDRTLCIGDGSGDWQNSERTVGGRSFDEFRKRGWIWIYAPDAPQGRKKNPDVMDRLGVANARMKSLVVGANRVIQAVRRHLMIDPRCWQTVKAFKNWKNLHGFPNKRSPFAHAGDAATYPIWYFYPKRLQPTGVEWKRLQVGGRRGEIEGY